MATLFAKVAVVATLALGLLGATAETIGSVKPYAGELCGNYVDYPVWVPPGQTPETIEAGLVKERMSAEALKILPPNCLEPFMQYVCSSTFPRVENTTRGNEFLVRFGCKSTCQAVVKECAQLFQSVGKAALVPDCDQAIPSTKLSLPPNGVLFQPDDICNRVQAKSGGNGNGNGNGIGTGNQTGIPCAAPFIKDPMLGPGGTTTNEKFCMLGCCLPCPAQYHLYREGAIETGYKITDTMRAVSMVLSFILLISYMCLPDKRAHPSAMILFFSVCVFLFSVVVIFPLVNTRGMQCADLVNPSTQQNNTKCAIQGGILIFSCIGMASWCTAIILNLHMHTVWNSAWFSNKYWMLHILCWGYCIAVTAAALGMGEVKWEYSTLCLISQDKAPQMFFYPMAALVFPAFLVHIATFIHIAIITARAGMDSETMSRSTLSAGAKASVSHRRHVLMAIKIQWRAAVMAVCSILTVTFYWLFYFIQLPKIAPAELQVHVLEFAKCLMSGEAHDPCADKMAPHLPPYGLMIAAEFLVSTIGTMLFIVFFKASLIHEWREWVSSVGYLLRGSSRRRKQEQDQFFVI